jgi:hypothetical protein
MSRFRPRNLSPATGVYAAYWLLGLSYNFWMTVAELRAGVPIPPLNIGMPPKMRGRIVDLLGSYIVTGKVPA